jgi:hypothetical protein
MELTHDARTSEESVRTLDTAHAIWTEQHPAIVSRGQWAKPDKERNFLDYCEWLLWEHYMRWTRSGNVLKSGTEEWILGFYIKLATSPDIKRVCGDECRSREQADGLLGLLYRESDRMRPDRPADDPVFGTLMGRQIARAERLKLIEEQKQARADLRQFAAMKAAMDRLSLQDQTELRKVVEKYECEARRVLAPPLRGPAAISFNGELWAPPAPSPSASTPARRGGPSFGHASDNTYLALVQRLVKKAYRGRDELEKAVAIVQQFSPGLLPNQYDANRLGSRLKPFTSKPGVSQYLKGLETDFVTRTPFTAVLSLHAPRPRQS